MEQARHKCGARADQVWSKREKSRLKKGCNSGGCDEEGVVFDLPGLRDAMIHFGIDAVLHLLKIVQGREGTTRHDAHGEIGIGGAIRGLPVGIGPEFKPLTLIE